MLPRTFFIIIARLVCPSSSVLPVSGLTPATGVCLGPPHCGLNNASISTPTLFRKVEGKKITESRTSSCACLVIEPEAPGVLLRYGEIMNVHIRIVKTHFQLLFIELTNALRNSNQHLRVLISITNILVIFLFHPSHFAPISSTNLLT